MADEIDFDNMTLDELFNVPFVFWVCPKGCRGMVEWERLDGGVMRATCKVCGEVSGDYRTATAPEA